MTRGRKFTIAGLLAAGLTSLPLVASAAEYDGEAQVLEGLVVVVSAEEVIIDLGRDHGLPQSAVVQFYRRLEVTHPVTDAVIVDRFPIGAVNLAEVGRYLSIVRRVDRLSRNPVVGDFVVYEPQALEAEAAHGVVDVRSGPDDEPPDVIAAATAFRATLGQSLPERILIWEIFLHDYPDSPLVPTVASELAWLRRTLIDERDDTAPQSSPSSSRLEAHTSIPAERFSDEPLWVAAAVIDRERVEAIRVLVRRVGDPTWVTLPMFPEGDHNWAVDIGPEWREPGQLELFVEAARTDGELELLAGSASHPRTIALQRRPVDTEITRGRSRASLVFDVVDFDSGPSDDLFIRFESDYRYLIDLGVLRAFRIGVGIFDGAGASLERLESGGPSEHRSLNYGFAEIEVSGIELVGLSWRVSAGNSQREVNEQFGDFFGQRLELRIGEEEATRLELGFALTDEIGNEAWMELHLHEVESLPMTASVVVSDLPVGADLGVSLNYGIGYQITDWLAVSSRFGLNARTINHFGFTGGLGTVLTW
jgi:hypothetical protein